MKKVVIFGATGNIGAYLTDYCKRNLDKTQYEVIAVGRKKTNFFRNNGIEYIQVDVCHEEDFERLPVNDIYAVVNLAGILPAYTQNTSPLFYTETNINGSLRILEYARKTGADKCLYTQTWSDLAGYWGEREVLSPDLPRKLKYTGDHAFYSITKSMIVDTMEYYKETFGLKNFIFRLPNIYLYSPIKSYFVDGISKVVAYRYMIDRASKGLDIEMWGNPSAFKDIIYVKDLCQMMLLAITNDKLNGGTYNTGTGIKTTLKEQIEGMIQVFSPKDHQSHIIPKPEKPGFVSFIMDIENAKQELGYQPKYNYISYLEDYKKEQEAQRFDDLWLGRI